jgi:DNA-binding IclR family transcriptional regulator
MLRDVPITTLRLLLRIANAFALDFLEISRGERDFTDALILSVLMQSTSAGLGRGPQQQRLYAAFDTPVPGPLRRRLSINAVATSLALPFETVRRRTKRLVAEGVCEMTTDGLQITEALLRSAEHRRALEETYEAVKGLYLRIARARCLDALDLPACAEAYPADADPPVRIVWRGASDYFLRLIEVLPAVANLTQAFVFMEVFRANTQHISDAIRGGDSVAVEAFIPDSDRRPVRTSDVAIRLGLPHETTRRNLQALVEDGRVQRLTDGYFVPAATLAQPKAFHAWNSNLLSISRMFADLAHTGVLALWDMEQARAVSPPSPQQLSG